MSRTSAFGPLAPRGWRGLGAGGVQPEVAAIRGLLVLGGFLLAVLTVAVVYRLHATRRGSPHRHEPSAGTARRLPRGVVRPAPPSPTHPDPWATAPIPIIAAPPRGVRVAPYVLDACAHRAEPRLTRRS